MLRHPPERVQHELERVRRLSVCRRLFASWSDGVCFHGQHRLRVWLSQRARPLRLCCQPTPRCVARFAFVGWVVLGLALSIAIAFAVALSFFLFLSLALGRRHRGVGDRERAARVAHPGQLICEPCVRDDRTCCSHGVELVFERKRGRERDLR